MKKLFSHILLLAVFPLGGMAISPALEARDTMSGYQLRVPGESFLQQFRDDPAFIYVREKPSSGWWEQVLWWLQKHLNGSVSVPGLGWLKILLGILIVLLVLFLIYKFIRFRFSERHFNEESPGLEDTLDETSYPRLIDEALAANDYVLAVRIHYWYVLHLLSQKGFIRWNKHKTNRSYVYELKDEVLQKRFCRLSYHFDCVCYGEFQVDEALYRQLEQEFNEFQQEIGK